MNQLNQNQNGLTTIMPGLPYQVSSKSVLQFCSLKVRTEVALTLNTIICTIKFKYKLFSYSYTFQCNSFMKISLQGCDSVVWQLWQVSENFTHWHHIDTDWQHNCTKIYE
jgi:hypothetical protein